MTDLPTEMRAIDPGETGGPEVMQVVTRPVPQAGPGEVLIEIHAAGVNRPDVLQRMGLYPMPPGITSIMGLEVSGRIAALGEGVTHFTIGDPVCALVPGGGYAEYVNAPAGSVLPVPDGIDMIDAAGLPESYFTVWSNLFERGAAKDGETVLVHGGTSGIGTTAIQLCNAFDVKVFVTAGSDGKCDAARQVGADLAINYRTEDFVERVKAAAPGGVDVVLDMVGGDYVPRNIECLGEDGRHVSIAMQRGAAAEVSILAVMAKRLRLTGSFLRPRPAAFKALVARSLHETVWPEFAAGKLSALTDRVYPLEQAADAHRRMEAGDHVGKILLKIR
ncbi:NAD(P)H-quinone oxidoreductase [Pacificimonas sp. WHA3]|uniref:NAD(P)H-quinone oxidoreductase n=1 Tax=Pacificimonas pallii TaxID=2827236 RepID=A0ABS6SCF0_9SPHN|nr:NAD(P)H-quinone oxidoreductase [Pacificimonas pallii]MBV7256054.1 NAD(P)H-quinone oxidoreductase [Pacificimonas pallii]